MYNHGKRSSVSFAKKQKEEKPVDWKNICKDARLPSMKAKLKEGCEKLNLVTITHNCKNLVLCKKCEIKFILLWFMTHL